MMITDLLARRETRYTGVAAGGFAQMVPEQVLVNPDGPAAAKLIKEMALALRSIQNSIQTDPLIYLDPELANHADAIGTLLRGTGL